ncbi:MAG: flagellar motor protein MotB [Pseudomonadales bacterium]|nr:flagellar motor protein MotB [Pseudomonadales bacterium]
MEDEVKQGLPAWLATFADLMALLMCFFVLLLSFSEMDVQKYKQVAGSMRDAFGVQNQIRASGIPMGTSVIAQEFSPGRPEPTMENIIQQQTQDITRMSLRTGFYSNGRDGGDRALNQGEVEAARQFIYDNLEQLQRETERDARILRSLLSREIAEQMVEIETGFRSITVRIRERGSFDSGSSVLNGDFLPVLSQLRQALAEIEGQVAIEGHTDNRPIATPAIPTNWHLSSLRALSVAHALIEEESVDSDRFQVIGFADSRPVASNDTSQDRAKNRRVEIVIRQGVDEEIVRNLEQVEGIGSSSFESWFENFSQ